MITRLKNEQDLLDKEDVKCTLAYPVEDDKGQIDYSKWEVEVSGMSGTPYDGACIKYKILFPPNYPMYPPSVVFDPVLYHPAVSQASESAGHICLDLINPDKYNATTHIYEILRAIYEVIEKPSEKGAVNPDMMKNPADFKKGCQEWVSKNKAQDFTTISTLVKKKKKKKKKKKQPPVYPFFFKNSKLTKKPINKTLLANSNHKKKTSVISSVENSITNLVITIR
eukprot:TRINITY_DN10557_c0_g1_i2.p1 TRINITY_DN10557_c0_g1~~TRINITY_DN10557_c0_g1_i2.p1  ORF type:complete len:225 (+),score=35.00 TRINITY_DN10557_c0_g1_i2:118-792(+)